MDTGALPGINLKPNPLGTGGPPRDFRPHHQAPGEIQALPRFTAGHGQGPTSPEGRSGHHRDGHWELL